MKITEYALFALALLQLTFTGVARLLAFAAAFALFAVIAALFYLAMCVPIYLILG